MFDFSPEQIKAAYIERCKELNFSNKLKKPTDANVKKACLALYSKKNGLADKYILLNFLGLREEEDIVMALKKTDPEKFRPIVYFLKDKTVDPRNETIELVAWLIDFGEQKAEPILAEQKSLSSEKMNDEKEDKGSNIVGNLAQLTLLDDGDKTKTIQNDNPKSPKLSNRAVRNSIIFLVLFIASIEIFVFGGINRFINTDTRMPQAHEKCMYWNGYQYEPVVCQDTIYFSKRVIPLNMKELINLKKIDRPDTLTTSDIGKVWYHKVNSQLQLFTSSGAFPMDTNRVLKPLSKYMYYEHIAYKFDGLYKWKKIGYIFVIVGVLTALIDYLFILLMKKKKSRTDFDTSLLSSR